MTNKQTSELIKQLEILPSFKKFCVGVSQNLTTDNWYVANNETFENLLNNQGDDFDEFVHCDNIRNPTTELIREIIKACRANGLF